MKLCCANCFEDTELRSKIYKASSLRSGHCDFCEGNEDKVIETSFLRNEFEFLIDSFFERSVIDTEGSDLSNLLQDKFLIFSESVVSLADLLQEILNNSDTYTVGTKYKPLNVDNRYFDLWKDLKSELIELNRFFPKNELLNSVFRQASDEHQVFLDLISQLRQKFPNAKKVFRARISEEVLSDTEMKKPPFAKASSGRANPEGISYLYVAEEIITAASEVRPSKGEKICIATLKANEQLSVLDLTAPRKVFNPTIFEDDQLITAVALIEFLESLSNDLSTSVISNKKLNYLPTQFFCEFIKSLNIVQGIKYRSSFDNRINYVFFEPKDSEYFTLQTKVMKSVSAIELTVTDL